MANLYQPHQAKILIVIPRNVLIGNPKDEQTKGWIGEIRKWGYAEYLSDITFTTYVSLHKHIGHWNLVIFDEAHHLSERCQDIIKHYKIDVLIGLSATFNPCLKSFYAATFSIPKKNIIRVDTMSAIEDGVLPTPKLVFMPIDLDNTKHNFVYTRKAKKGFEKLDTITIDYSETFKYRTHKGAIDIKCSEAQYYAMMSQTIEWYGGKFGKSSPYFLRQSLIRLHWLAERKESFVKKFLKKFTDVRTLVFSPSIQSSENLGCSCVNSKVGVEDLSAFNKHEIDHISAVECLTEGANLEDCKVCLFQIINSSTRITVQKIGRGLRHSSPVLIFPYYRYSREEELVKRLAESYDANLIYEIDSLTKLKKLLY
jgi:superfamily II DNA or RNA helicase